MLNSLDVDYKIEELEGQVKAYQVAIDLLKDQLRRRNLQIKDLKRELAEAVKYFNLNEQGKAREKTSEFLNTLKK